MIPELQDRTIAAYAANGPHGRLLDFVARRADELLHFGTAPETWGSGPATWLHCSWGTSSSAG